MRWSRVFWGRKRVSVQVHVHGHVVCPKITVKARSLRDVDEGAEAAAAVKESYHIQRHYRTAVATAAARGVRSAA
jgi:hypothetical protein